MPKTKALGWGAEGTNALEPDYFEKQGEQWPGKAGSQSSGKPKTGAAKKKSASPKLAQTTARRLKTDPEESATAASTAGSGKAGK